MTNKIEQKNESIAVWLILSDGENMGKVALQRRSLRDGKKMQSFPYVFQPTWNGKLNLEEDVGGALIREAKEELGPKFRIPELKLFCKEEYVLKSKTYTAYNYFGFISEKNLLKTELHSAAEPGFYFLGKEDFFKIKFAEEQKVDPKKEIVLFRDQHETLKKLFQIIS
jgi:ADP-ribose pyrophosphatase YjhB (NUDIX family)